MSKSIFPLLALLIAFSAQPATAGGDRDAFAALDSLYESTPAARDLSTKAKAVLVFPNIVKAGFIIGAQYGNGALIQGGEITGRYNITAGSYGLQAGAQSFGYAMMLMSDYAVKHVETSSGWELGVGPSVVVVDSGVAKTFSTKTIDKDIYAFTFGQQGLMAGLGLQGTKITRRRD